MASKHELCSQLSAHNPMAAVCARGDLDAQSPHPKVCCLEV